MKKIILLTIFLFFGMVFEVRALCVTSRIKTKQLKGIAADSRGNPFPNIKLELKNPNDFDFVIKTVVTDDEGKFDFGEMKSGRYVIYASNQYVPSFSFQVKHKKVKKIKDDEPKLKITVGVTFSGGCKGWSASYGKQST